MSTAERSIGAMTDREEKNSRVGGLKSALAKDNAQAAVIIGEIISDFPMHAAALIFRAAHGSKKRESALVELLLARGDAGCAVSDQAVERVLADAKHGQRDSAIQQMAFRPERMRFAPVLRNIVRNRTGPHWASAVASLGALKDKEAIGVLMEHTCGQGTPFVVISALVHLRCPEAALVFEPNLTHPDPRTRTFALWGLASLKYEAALGALVHLLDDPDIYTPTQFEPGQSRKAAQALADIHGWPFEWGNEASFDEVKRRCRERYSDAFVQMSLSALLASTGSAMML